MNDGVILALAIAGIGIGAALDPRDRGSRITATEATALDRKAAGRKAPIRLGDTVPFVLRWTPMDRAWCEGFDAKYPPGGPLASSAEKTWSEERKADYKARRGQLMSGLLGFGGDRVCIPGIEDDLNQLLLRGQLWSGRGAVLKRGQASRCHSNSAALWQVNRENLKIVTGYGLSKDGMWRQHSWGLWLPGSAASATGPSSKPKIVETTEKRIAYFGYVMTDAEASAFYEQNC